MADTNTNPVQGLSSIGIDIKIGEHTVLYATSIGDLGGAPEDIDVTCLKDKRRKNIPGVESSDTWEMQYLYSTHEEGDYRKLKAIETAGKVVPVVVKIPGAAGEPTATFSATGYVKTRVNGAGLSEGVMATCSVNLQTDWVETYAEASGT